MGKRLRVSGVRLGQWSTLAVAGVLLTACVTPKPIQKQDRVARASSDRQTMFAAQEPIDHDITLYEAMARAVKYNLDYRLKLMESIVANSALDISRFDMLPSLVADAGYSSRSNDMIIKSRTGVTDGSTSSDRERGTAKLQLAWNVLDFGVSYVSAKQNADRYLIAVERQRKMIQNIVRDVRYAYWRAVGAQSLLTELPPLMHEINAALITSKRMHKAQIKAPQEALQYQKTLLELVQQLMNLQRDMGRARAELAGLMNVSPNTPYRLVKPERGQHVFLAMPHDLRVLEDMALEQRPELREEDYRDRISSNEIRKARLRLLPGIELSSSYNYDSNSFLVNNTWTQVGTQLTWNVLNLFTANGRIQHAYNNYELEKLRRMALSMAILTQVDVSAMRYKQAQKEMQVAAELERIENKLFRQAKKEQQVNKSHRLAMIHAKVNHLIAGLRYDLSYAELENAAGQVLSALGHDPVANLMPDQTILQMAQHLQDAFLAVHEVGPLSPHEAKIRHRSQGLHHDHVPYRGHNHSHHDHDAQHDYAHQSHQHAAEKPKATPKAIKQLAAANPAQQRSVVEMTALRQDKANILKAAPEHFTVQIMGDTTLQQVAAFKQQHNLAQARIFYARKQKAAQKYGLILGDFKSQDDADAAILAFSDDVFEHRPWVRQYRSLQSMVR